MQEDGILLFFSLGMVVAGIAFIRDRGIVSRSLDSMRGRSWVWVFGPERAITVMQRVVGPALVVFGSAFSVVFLRNLP